MIRKKIWSLSFVFILILGLGASYLTAWETPWVIAGKDGHSYYKSEIAFGPSGAVYVTYREKQNATGLSDIYLCTYTGKDWTYENVSEGATFWAKYKSYEADVVVDMDERVHVAWVAHDKIVPGVHYLKYRTKKGSTWSEIYDMGNINMPSSSDHCFDLRLDVDGNFNAHIVTYLDKDTSIWYTAKYGDTIIPIRRVGGGGYRDKHPDIAVDNNFVHVLWMRKMGTPYHMYHQKWENKLDGAISAPRRITPVPKDDYSLQKGRIDVDSDGKIHMLEFAKSGNPKKLKYYKEQADGSMSKYVNLSHPEKLELYHYADIIVRGDTIFTSWQLGKTYEYIGGVALYYNWKRNGQWEGYQVFPSPGVLHQAADLTIDGQIAAITYVEANHRIKMMSSEPIMATGLLEAEFTYPATIFSGSEVTFDASACTALNPDANIVSYTWDFGDGTIETTSNPTITHMYNAYHTNAEVLLTITNDSEDTGEISKSIYIDGLYGALVTSTEAKRVRTLFFNRPAYEISWTDNPKNTEAGYPSIVRYEIWRAEASSSLNDGDYSKAGEVNAGTTYFLDYFGLKDGVDYVYAIRCIDSEGHISPINNL